MNKISLSAGAAMALIAASASGETASQPHPPATQPQPAATSPAPAAGTRVRPASDYSAMSLLNNGNGVQAAAISAVRQVDEANRIHDQAILDGLVARGDDTSNYYVANRDVLQRVASSYAAGALGIVDHDTVEIPVETRRRIITELREGNVPIVAASAIPGPTSPAGSRPTSGYEAAQTQAMLLYRETLQARIVAAQELERLATANGYVTQAAATHQIIDNATSQLADTNRVLALSERYDGRAFDSESAARSYVNARESIATQITDDPGVRDASSYSEGNVPSDAQRIREIAGEMVGGTRSTNSNSALGESLRALDAADTAVRRSSAHIGVSTDFMTAGNMDDRNLWDFAAEVRRSAQSHGDAVPGANQSGGTSASVSAAGRAAANGARGAAAGAETNHSIDEIPGASASSSGSQARAGTAQADATPIEDNTPPEPVPTHENYPTVSAEERARISREAAERRAAEQATANAVSAAVRFAQEAAAREAAERAAMVERARISDENHRLMLAAQRQTAQDNAWAAMVHDRFGNGAWDAFAEGRTVTTLQLEDIYRNYDPMRAVPPAMSLSSTGNSLSSAGWSPSLAGLDYRDPAVESLNEVLYQLTTRLHSPFDIYDQGDPARAAQMSYNAGPFDVRYNRDGRESLESGGYLAASLFDFDDPYLRQLTANGLTGLDALLAQPFNVILTWGAGANDLDLHMTGPLGEGTSNRFHIYYSATGDLDGQPFAKLIKDCVCSSGSEVILTSALNRGGVYRVSAFNFGDQSAGSSVLSNASQAQIQIVRGGTVQSVGNGSTITGGHTILTTSVPNGGLGNTWVAVELDPKNGRITVPRRIKQSAGSGSVD